MNRFFVNQTQVPDVTAPRPAKLEAVLGRSASPAADVVRVQVYDNVPAPILYFDDVTLEVAVDGVDLPAVPMRSSGGQIFRGEIPGNLLGTIEAGKLADLYVVDGNPLQDVRAATKGRYVMVRGELYDVAALFDAVRGKIGPVSAADVATWSRSN